MAPGGDYAHADVVLIGVSRVGKTPTCVYLALQYGVFAANYPLTEDDLEAGALARRAWIRSAASSMHSTIRPERLQQIRNERRPESRYASRAQVTYELRTARGAVRALRDPIARYHRVLDRGNRQPHPQYHRNRTAAASLTAVCQSRIVARRVLRVLNVNRRTDFASAAFRQPS